MTAETFFAELERLLSRYPKSPSEVHDSENSDYGDYLYFCKNMHIAFDCAQCADCLYTYDSYMTKNCIDADYCVGSELCYESVDAIRCFNSDYLEYSTSVRDSAYSANCINCNNVFGCVNLVNKSFCIFNRQLTEAEYHQKVAFYKQWPAEKILAIVEDLKKRYPFTPKEGHNENSPYGNYIHFCKNCYMCFDAGNDENCAYLYDSFYNKTSIDMTYASQHSEVSYQIVDSDYMFNCSYSVRSSHCIDSTFLFNCRNVKNSLGCVSLQNKEYCILNRQLTKDQYETVSKQILEELKAKNLGWANLAIH